MRFLVVMALFFIAGQSFAQSDAILLNYDTDIIIKSNGDMVEQVSVAYEIYSSDYNWLGEVSLPYSKDESLDLLEANILDTRGNITRKLKKKDISVHSDLTTDTFHDDQLVLEFTLQGHEYPYRLEYKYQRTTKDYFYIAHWLPYYSSNVSVKNAKLSLHYPKNFKVLKSFSPELKYDSTFAGEVVETWEAHDLPAFEGYEKFSPLITEIAPSVKLVPAKFYYETMGYQNSWSSFGTWINDLIYKLEELPVSEQQKIDQLIKGVSDRKEIVKILYHYLQDNTRYINVSLETGGLKPFPASYVCDKKYGDCKGLTIYMKAMLSYVGINSYYTLIDAGDKFDDVDFDFPSQQFNHVVLMVPFEKDTVWLENTSQINPFNYMGTFTQGRYAFVVDGSNSKFVKTPSLTSDNSMSATTYNYTLDHEGNGELHIKKHLTGAFFEQYNALNRNVNAADQQKYLSRVVHNSGTELENFELTENHRDSTYIGANLTCKVKDQVQDIAGMKVVQPHTMNLSFERPASRKLPVKINYPVNQLDSMVYNLSWLESGKVEIPAPVSVDSDYGSFSLKCEKKGNQILFVRRFELYTRTYSLAEYPKFYEFFENIEAAEKKVAAVITP
ncbi:DUF3857 domain-containing protein [Fulvivirga ligni]|uniref:DUF3857 domain-containing protein n=1 Tax=Fulvivirga ligni TaxID=2904246 RepID=UPI001F2B959B|nr:DUF3857 domain-containing protein [Fulvivirga ligni]UII20912.1 transglutaminase-like domain-containing protein [Fulvivirga ligni]